MAQAENRNGKLTGIWIGQVKLKTGRFKRSFETKREAEAYESYVRLMGVEPPAVVEGRAVAPKGRSFREIAQRCKDAGGPRGTWHKGRDKSTLQRLDYAIARIGDYDIDDITRSLVREKIATPLSRTPRAAGSKYAPVTKRVVSQGTINNYVATVSAVLTWAVHEDILKAKPALEFKAADDSQERTAISFELEDRIVGYLLSRGLRVYSTCVRFLVETGLRRGEMMKLRPEQIGNDVLSLEKKQTKTNTARSVYCRADLAREMRAIIAAGTLPDPTHLLRVYQEAAKSVGHDSPVTLHGLRHTRATRLMSAKVAREVRMYILGHVNKGVHDGYVHVSIEDQRAAADAVDQMRGAERPSGATVTRLSV